MDDRVRPGRRYRVRGSCICCSAIVTETYSFTTRQNYNRTTSIPIRDGNYTFKRFEFRVRFSFSALLQLNSSAVLVHYRLAGLPDEWIKNLRDIILPLILKNVRLPSRIQTLSDNDTDTTSMVFLDIFDYWSR